ncbi:AcrR family transcriptional regulator [Amycolatopsis bartoniae]|uniref:TetR family transcriptional regulator n=1 Tax=Amycolatopsis bartoniae TaxID=941986 RepID=A0A8H9J552_9PSEU|nr:TetR/AcrR family transcriptional regulator [Amycolatopsis bartoniae]MBB2935465.1 AcrR family transcriptional regulator [Amycolatopsis bartoniae]TVT04478.1 helix-turn-helix transcriptional regulator [Amycolatopsis bartoniae]GHF76201.1 TetR family transcriptional regulator [Amycolatopsis bartoniae]
MSSPPRTLRADAARNRELLLAAAEAEFAERGPDASVADIARRAGVGKGTVFRHFATKDELIAAIVRTHACALDEVGQRLLTAEDPAAALLEFLTVAGGQREQRDLSFLLNADDAGPEVVALRERLYRTVGLLVDRAREAGAVRADVTGNDVVLLMCAPNHVVGYVKDPPPDLWRRYLAIIFDGLRPEGAHPLAPPAPEF